MCLSLDCELENRESRFDIFKEVCASGITYALCINAHNGKITLKEYMSTVSRFVISALPYDYESR